MSDIDFNKLTTVTKVCLCIAILAQLNLFVGVIGYYLGVWGFERIVADIAIWLIVTPYRRRVIEERNANK